MTTNPYRRVRQRATQRFQINGRTPSQIALEAKADAADERVMKAATELPTIKSCGNLDFWRLYRVELHQGEEKRILVWECPREAEAINQMFTQSYLTIAVKGGRDLMRNFKPTKAVK
jgi:hypothetical protein